MKAKLVAGLLLLLVGIVFTLQNAEVVSVRFLFWGFSMSRVILLFLVFVAGAGAGWALCSYTRAMRDADRV